MYRQKKNAFRGRSRNQGEGEKADVSMPGIASLIPGRFRSPIAWAAAVPVVAALFFAGWFAIMATTDGDKARLAGGETPSGASGTNDIEMAPASGPAE